MQEFDLLGRLADRGTKKSRSSLGVSACILCTLYSRPRFFVFVSRCVLRWCTRITLLYFLRTIPAWSARFDSPEELDSALARGRARRSEGCGTMADALKEAASKKLEGFSQDVKVRLVP
jgi:hypothetical protein